MHLTDKGVLIVENFQVHNRLVQMPRMGHFRLVWLQTALCAPQASFPKYSAEDIEWLTTILRSVLSPNPPDEFERYFEDGDLEDYGRIRLCSPLPGSSLTQDSGNRLNWVQSDLVHFGPPTIEERRAYLRHDLLPRLAKVLVQTIAELTPERASGMSLDALMSAEALAEVLVGLDKLNEDEGRHFEERLNPSIDIFGDISHDVLQKRLREAIKAARAEAVSA